MAFKGELKVKGFKELVKKIEDTRQVHSEIADTLESSTKLRFRDAVDPEGTPWLPLQSFRRKKKDKRGNTLKGQKSKNRAFDQNPKPLNDTGRLKRSITSNFDLENIRVGTNLEYAPPHQLGSEKKHKLGSDKKHIPARPFLGLSGEDRLDIIAILKKWILKK